MGRKKLEIMGIHEGTIDVHLCLVSSSSMLPPQLPMEKLHIAPGGSCKAAQKQHHHSGLSQAKLAS